MKTWCVLWLALVCAAASAGPGEIYRWKDGEGRTHFGDEPPEDVAVVRLEHLEDQPTTGSRRPPGDLTPSPLPQGPRVESGKAPVHSNRDDAADAARESRASHCDEFRQRLQIVRSRMRQGYTAAQYNTLADAERRYKDGIDQNCR